MNAVVKHLTTHSEACVSASRRSALVIQGGGMRGAYSMAALMALEECGLGHVFDHAIGSSAGAINAAYFIAGQAKEAVTVYLDDLSNRRFVNFARLRRIVDVDYLVDEVLRKRKALDVRTVLASRTTLHVVLTDTHTGDPVVVTNKTEGVDLMEAIRATAAMPLLYNKTVAVAGGRYIDGGISESIPLGRALQLACHEIVVILTRPLSFRRQPPSRVMRWLLPIMLSGCSERLRARVLLGDESVNEVLLQLQQPDTIKEACVHVISPSDPKRMVERTTTCRRRLVDCALMARNDVRRLLGFPEAHDNPFG